jgi:hypothetical protein
LESFNDQAVFHENRDVVMENILYLIQCAQDRQQDNDGQPTVALPKTSAAKPSARKQSKPLSRKASACLQEVSL